MSDIAVADNPGRKRYEVRLDGELAGFSAYRTAPGRVIVTHTEIDPAFGGHGVGTALVRELLADLRGRGLLLTPLCPFVAAYLDKHPGEYDDLLAHPASEANHDA